MIFVYAIAAIESDKIESVKIGVSDEPDKRLVSLQTGNHRKLKLIYSINIGNPRQAYEIEGHIHNELKDYRQNGEWFSIDGKVGKYLRRFFQENSVKESFHDWQPSSFYVNGEI